MSSVQIISETKTAIATYMTLACGKVTATVSHNPTYTDAVRVCVQNNSNRAYRMGVDAGHEDGAIDPSRRAPQLRTQRFPALVK